MRSFDTLPVSEPRWLDFISGHSRATIFHHPAWIATLADCYGYRPFLGVVRSEGGEIQAGLPIMEVRSWLTGRRAVALPFSDFCRPLAVDDNALDKLVRGLQGWRRAEGPDQLCIRWPLPEGDSVYAGQELACHVTGLASDPEQVFARFKKTRVQQPIGQAERAGVVVRPGRDWQDLQLFYALHVQTRRRLGTPVQPLRFFRLLWDNLLAEGLGMLLLAYHDAQPLAGAVFLHWNEVLTYKYSASDSEYWHLRPNNLLLWHAIKWGCEQGYRVFDWGKADLENKGLRSFKRGWGSEETVIHYSVLADQAPTLEKGPARTQEAISAIIQRSPAWVGRAIGELLYGHFG